MVTIILYNKKIMLIKKIISPVARHAPSLKKKKPLSSVTELRVFLVGWCPNLSIYLYYKDQK